MMSRSGLEESIRWLVNLVALLPVIKADRALLGSFEG